MTDLINGVVVVDKPVGPTSFAVVRQARRVTGARKVGHGGTLDPMASGVLPLCFGEATKLAQFLLDADKEYEAVIAFGAETDTYDATGTTTARYPTEQLDEEQVRAALAGFLGQQSQVPPMYSALKRAGRPLYDYARAGETIERAPRIVQFHALELGAFWRGSAVDHGPAGDRRDGREVPLGVDSDGVPSARLFMRCSKGTYVRSLAYDLGRVLGCGAHLTGLRRTRSGPFGLDHAISPDALVLGPLPVMSPADALAHLPTVTVADDVARDLSHGKPVTWSRAQAADGVRYGSEAPLVRILATTGSLLAVAPGGALDDAIRTLRVFNPTSTPTPGSVGSPRGSAIAASRHLG